MSETYVRMQAKVNSPKMHTNVSVVDQRRCSVSEE